MQHGLAMARGTDPVSYAMDVNTFAYFFGNIGWRAEARRFGCARDRGCPPDCRSPSSDDLAVAPVTKLTLGVALVHHPTAAERDRGQQLLTEVSELFLRRGHHLADRPLVEVYVARERARRGDRDEAIPLMRAAVDHLFRQGQLLLWGIPGTVVLVETLLDRGTEADVAEAEAAIERFAAAPAEEGLVIRDIWLLRLRALLARAHGDNVAYRDFW